MSKSGHKSKPLLRRFAYVIYFVVVVMLLLEVALRIYNPFHFRIKGDNIVLDVNKSYSVDNSRIPVLEKVITHSKNGLGFRGPELPADILNRLSIVTVGGSTTECSSIADGKTWTDQLAGKLQARHADVWVNNAGLAGHSTFGHIALMKDRIISLGPDYVVFMVGVNDIRRTDLTDSDKSNSSSHHKTVFTYLSRRSELCNVLLNLARNREAQRRNLTDTYLDLSKAAKDPLYMTDGAIRSKLTGEELYLKAYRDRLNELVSLSLANRIRPVLVTQAMLVGEGIDPVSKVNLETIKIDREKNGKLWWTMLEMYNDVTRAVAAEYDLQLVDVGRELPKSSRYFYDAVHFTNEGCQEVAEIISRNLRLQCQ